MLPDGIFERLTPAQLRAVIAHELCHVRHRDNLAAAVHMLVEAVFWWMLADRIPGKEGAKWDRRGKLAADQALRIDAELERRLGAGHG